MRFLSTLQLDADVQLGTAPDSDRDEADHREKATAASPR
jgi:hypothetical protein